MRKIFYGLAIVFGVLLIASFNFQNIEAIPPPNPSLQIIDSDGNSISSVKVGQEIQIVSSFRNEKDVEYSYHFTHGISSNPDVDFPGKGWQNSKVTLESGEIFNHTLSWIPQKSGQYKAHQMVFDSVENRVAFPGTLIPFTVTSEVIFENNDKEILQCDSIFILIQKYNGSPACVKPKTAEILIKRGWAESTQESKIIELDQTQFSLTYTVTAPGTNPLTLKIDAIDDVWFYFGESLPESRFAYSINKETFTQLQNQIFDSSFFDLDDEYFPVSEPKSNQVYKIEVKTNDISKSIQWKPNSMLPNNLVNIYSILMEIKDDYTTSSFVYD